MKNISLFTALLLSSSLVYGGWTYYEFGGMAVPKASCLEMICPHGCVEHSETLEGKCCPDPETGTNCVSDVRNEYNCLLKKKICGSGHYCNQSSKTCQAIPSCPACQKFDTKTAKCVADTTKNNQQVQDACHKCSNGQVVLKDEQNDVPCGNQCCLKGYRCEEQKCCPEPAICDTTKECCVLDNINLDICGKPTKKTAQKITQKIGRLINGNCQEVEETYCPLIQEPPKGECSLCSQKVNSVILNKSTPGKVSVSVCDGRYRVTMTGGGGGSKMVRHSGKWGTRRCGGGSGGYFDGVLKLSKGDYTVVVGSGGERNYSGTATTAFGLTCSGGTSGNPGSGGGFSKQTAVQIIETYKSGRGNVGHCKQKRGKRGDTTAHGGASGITNTTSGAGAGGSGSYWGYNPGYSGLVKIQYLGP